MTAKEHVCLRSHLEDLHTEHPIADFIETQPSFCLAEQEVSGQVRTSKTLATIGLRGRLERWGMVSRNDYEPPTVFGTQAFQFCLQL